jgi:Protein of unknown function (DUF3501)
MKPIQRSELLDLGAYEEVRDRFRARVSAAKKARYVALGPAMTLLFENRDTVLFQVQEMLRTERITQAKAIEHELETYNELIPGDHELSATVFVEFPEREERERMLVSLAGVEDDFYVLVGDERLAVIPDRRGSEPDRTMAVQYVRFPLSSAAEAALRHGGSPLKLGVDHPAYRAEVTLGAETLASLRDDFE